MKKLQTLSDISCEPLEAAELIKTTGGETCIEGQCATDYCDIEYHVGRDGEPLVYWTEYCQ